MKTGCKVAINKVKIEKNDEDFYRWNKEFLELCDFLGIKPYLVGDKQYPSTQEILCDTLADEDEERYISDVVPWIHKDAFGRVFLTLPERT